MYYNFTKVHNHIESEEISTYYYRLANFTIYYKIDHHYNTHKVQNPTENQFLSFCNALQFFRTSINHKPLIYNTELDKLIGAKSLTLILIVQASVDFDANKCALYHKDIKPN